MKKNIRWQLPFFLFLIIGTILIVNRQYNLPYQTNNGFIFGTVYKITYQYETDLQKEIEAELRKVNLSLSPFEKNSIITRINENDSTVVPDSMFLDVFCLASKITKETSHAFDITIAPLVNAWGFGFKHGYQVDPVAIDSLRQLVGMEKISLKEGRISKTDPRIMLDCSAIAKGYGCDVIGRLLERKGVMNYMVEIGGEIVLKGKNSKHTLWNIGINKPVEDSLSLNNELQTIIQITDIALATSGNYRNYYYRDGKKYAHTINPYTGYPVEHSLLSATVLAPDCATADAYATSFMVLGLDSAIAICNRHPQLMGYFIYTDEQGRLTTTHSKRLEKYIKRH